MKCENSTPAKIGFIISAYKRPDLLERLVCALEGRPCSIHVDKNSSIFPDIHQALRRYENVTFLKQHKVYWGDFGHVAASLEGMHWFRTTHLDYAILLTGQCYPLVPIGYIEEHLGRLGGNSLIQHEAFPMPTNLFQRDLDRLIAKLPLKLTRSISDNSEQLEDCNIFKPEDKKTTKPSIWGESGLNRIIYYHLFFRGRVSRVPFFVRKFPLKLHPYGGSSYWCLSRECVEHVLDFIAENREVIRFFKNSYIPCESFFQTILGNSHLRSKLSDEEIHYLEWEGTNHSPNILDNAEKALASGKWFGRKFESLDVLDEIDRRLNFLRESGTLPLTSVRQQQFQANKS